MKLAILFVMAGAAAHAQVASATLSGTVTDPSDSAVLGAAVTLERKDTALLRTSQTTSAGSYVFDQILPGAYRLTVRSQGFQPYRAEVAVQLDQWARHDVCLTIGGAESIEVTAEVSPVDTESASI